MKKIILLVCLILSGTLIIFAQKEKPKSPEYTNYYKNIPPIVTDAVTITFEDIVSKMGYCKLKIRIKNNTTDYIMFKPTETNFKLGQGIFQPTDKLMVINPLESEFKVLDIKGNGNCLIDSFMLVINGLYRFPANEIVIIAPDFILPPSINTVNAGPFICTLLDTKKETQETWVRFDCVYTGNNAGIIDPNKAVIKLESGQEFANSKSNMKQSILFRGDNDKFTLFFNVPPTITDMQFANMQIVWRNTFLDSQIIVLPPKELTFVLDRGKTQGKNK